MTTDLPALWTSDGWRAEAHAWIRQSLATHGMRLVGGIEEVKVRFWSVLLRAHTDRGAVWFKENAPSQAFEAGLMGQLSRLAPGRTPPVLAVDQERGWLLTEDIGEPMGERRPTLDAEAAAEVAEVALAWSGVQRLLVRHREEMRRAGVPAFEEGNAIPYAVALADRLGALPRGDGRRLDGAGRRAVEAGLTLLGDAAARLEASGIPDSLQHNDLHPWNAMRDPVDGRVAFIDLGDAVWSHPFASLRIPAWLVRGGLGFAPGSAEVERVVDAYLEPWTDLGTTAELRRLLPAAERMSCLHRAESWRRLMADVPLSAVPEEWLDAPAHWLLAACAPDPYEATRD